MPTPPQYLAGKKVDRGVTNTADVKSSHWRPWLAPKNRCLVPFTSFSENETEAGRHRSRRSGSRSMRAGRSPFSPALDNLDLSVRKVKEGRVTSDFYGFLMSAPNAEVGGGAPEGDAGDPDRAGGVATWLTAPSADMLAFQRPLTERCGSYCGGAGGYLPRLLVTGAATGLSRSLPAKPAAALRLPTMDRHALRPRGVPARCRSHRSR